MKTTTSSMKSGTKSVVKKKKKNWSLINI